MDAVRRQSIVARTVLGSVVALVAAIAWMQPTQALVDARVLVVAKVTAPAPNGVTLQVELNGAGLTDAERRAGWQPLDTRPPLELALGDALVAREMPVRYCTFLWNRRPLRPPAGFLLRFSDAPGETYRLVGDAGYLVTRADGSEIPQTQAAWRIDVGRLQTEEPARPRRYRLELAVERQQPTRS